MADGGAGNLDPEIHGMTPPPECTLWYVWTLDTDAAKIRAGGAHDPRRTGYPPDGGKAGAISHKAVSGQCTSPDKRAIIHNGRRKRTHGRRDQGCQG